MRQKATYEVGKRETIFISGGNNLEVQNNSAHQAVVNQVQAPPHSPLRKISRKRNLPAMGGIVGRFTTVEFLQSDCL
jgi:hypothetical protein